MTHKAGFVSIIGKPNAGKSTLINKLTGSNLSIVTPKAQTTRHRIISILNDTDYQIIFTDTPGIIKPAYKLHENMMKTVQNSFKGADVLFYVTDIKDKKPDEYLTENFKTISIPIYILLNKVDLSSQAEVEEKRKGWLNKGLAKDVFPVSALEGFNLEKIISITLNHLPESEPFYPKEELSDKPEKFFAGEFIREQIFLQYAEEIPYCSEVQIISFKEEEHLIRIESEILVERESQKGILIGHKGEKLKSVLTNARIRIEEFFGKKVFLQGRVKTEPGWRGNERKLKEFGY